MTNPQIELCDIRDAFFDQLYEIASKDNNVIFLTADIGAWSLNKFRNDMPQQFVNVGIAEQNMVSVAAGLALGGKRVFIYSIVPFATERCFEQIKIDLCVMHLPVTIIGAGPGLTYSSDGPTHHSLEDVSLIRALPDIEIFSPCDQLSAKAAAHMAYESESPAYVRLDKGIRPLIYNKDTDFSKGVSLIKAGKNLLIVATGIMSHKALDLAEKLNEHSIDAGVVDMLRIKPLDKEELLRLAKKVNAVVTLEEHTITGGIGSAVSELLADEGVLIPIKRIGIKEECCDYYGDRDWYHSYYGLTIETVCNEIVDWYKEKSLPVNYRDLRAADFETLFGITEKTLPQEVCRLISECDFRYRELSKEESNRVVLEVLKKIDSNNMSVSGKERKNQWEKGWSENLQNFINNEFDILELVPKYYRPNNILRLNKRYVKSESDMFEFNFFRVLRHWIYCEYLSNVDSVFEFGCGSGYNLPVLASLFPGKELHGLDWAQSSADIVNKIGIEYGWRMTGHLFDMFFPDYSLEVNNNSAFLTFGSLEQLGTKYKAFVELVVNKAPALCVNVEPIYELYDSRNLIDYLAMKYHKKRGYLDNFLSYLRSLEKQNKVKIINVNRVCFGGLYHDGWSIIVWSPRNSCTQL